MFGRPKLEGGGLIDFDGGRSITPEQARALGLHASVEEVKKAVFGMKRFGSPGLQAIFYQKYWDVVSGEITGMVNNALETGKVPGGMLHAFIILIPKRDCPETTGDFRPITLLNVAFKIISKVLVNRFRPIMNKIIDPYQNSFLLGRSTLDNVILTQEIMHGMNKKKGEERVFDD